MNHSMESGKRRLWQFAMVKFNGVPVTQANYEKVY